VGKRSALALLYSIVKVLLIFQLYHPTKGTKVIFGEAIASSPPQRGKRIVFEITKKPP